MIDDEEVTIEERRRWAGWYGDVARNQLALMPRKRIRLPRIPSAHTLATAGGCIASMVMAGMVSHHFLPRAQADEMASWLTGFLIAIFSALIGTQRSITRHHRRARFTAVNHHGKPVHKRQMK